MRRSFDMDRKVFIFTRSRRSPLQGASCSCSIPGEFGYWSWNIGVLRLVRIAPAQRVEGAFRADFDGAFPGLKAWAVLSSPFRGEILVCRTPLAPQGQGEQLD